MFIYCYSRFFKQQLLLFFSIAANMLTCSMTWWYWLVYSISAEWKTKQFLFVCSSTELKACHTHFDSNNLPFSNKFFGMCFAQRTKKISMLIIKLFLFFGECNDFKNACNNFDADQYITSTGSRMLNFYQIKPNISL